MDTDAIGPLETTTIFDEPTTAYNVIVTEHGRFIISNYESTMTEEVALSIDGQPSGVHHQEEVLILDASEIDVEYQKYVNWILESNR